MKNLVFTCLLLLTSLLGFTQTQCGFKNSSNTIKSLLKSKADINATTQNRSLTYVPIQFHIIGNSAGEGHVKIGRLMNELCYLNEQYLDQEIQFYIHNDNLNVINNSNVYNNPATTGEPIMNLNKVSGVINIFITLAAPTTGNGITLGFYKDSKDWIVIIKSEIGKSTTSSTVAHEIGHYFSLLHTFNGCDGCNWVENTPPCPAEDYYGNVLTEFVNGNNCEIAGDYLCDTPADINLGFGQPCATYTGPACDPNDDPYNPDIENFMGYFTNCSDYHFSSLQKDIISANLSARINSSSLNLVNNNAITQKVEEDVVITSFQTNNNGVVINWNPTPNATSYFIEISRTPTFTITGYQSAVTTNTNFEFTGLTYDKTYYTRVMPYNQFGSCHSSGSNSFVTKTNNTIKEINNWVLSPNPNNKNSDTKMSLSTRNDISLKISIKDITGKTISSTKEKVYQGHNDILLNTSTLKSGTYIILIQSEDDINVKKLIIQ